jgi:hypothetical protein
VRDLLQRLDLDYYRSALLLAARVELARLRQEHSVDPDGERRSEPLFGTVPTLDAAATPEAAVASFSCGEPGEPRRE